jgi:hypothetical protein
MHQQQQVLRILKPHSESSEHFEALQAILEVCSGQYLR